MKKNIMAFDQAVLVGDGITPSEVIFMDWFLQFFGSPAMEYIQEDGVLYGKIRRSYVIEQLPILGLTSEKSVSRLILSLIEKGYLKKVVRTDRDKRSTLYLAIGSRAYEAAGILSSSAGGEEPGTNLSSDTGTEMSQDTSVSNTSTSYNYTHIYPGTKMSSDIQGHECPLYDRIFKEWSALGDRVVQPPNQIHFLSKAGNEIAPYTRGVHSSDVLQSIRNFGEVLEDPRCYWRAKISVYTFFQRHFEKFLPQNYRKTDFLELKELEKEKQEQQNKLRVKQIMETYQRMKEEQ